MRSSNETLIRALRILAGDIQSDDGVAQAAIFEAAQRIEELAERVKRLEEAGDAVLEAFRKDPDAMAFDDWVCMTTDARNNWRKAKETKP